ncbi:MAG: universal stress protein, partial [Wenzhouxiangellaceae bacterium]
ILLATDGSRAVREAEQVFVDLSAHFKKKIALTVVADDDSEVENKQCRTHLGGLAERVDGLDCRVVEGDPNELVAETAREVSADLTVIGKRGRNPMADLLLGSTAEAVARRA